MDDPTGARPAPTEERYDIRIARDGTWYHEGRPIGRKALVRLLASVLSRDAAGEYWLTTPAERGRIDVEDAPFIAVEMTRHGCGPDQVLKFRTNLDDEVEAGPEHPIRVAIDPATEEPSPYILVRDGLEARLARAVFYDLVNAAAQEDRDGQTLIGVWSKRTFFPFGTIPDT